jgi:hypothetical protein
MWDAHLGAAKCSVVRACNMNSSIDDLQLQFSGAEVCPLWKKSVF